MRLRRVLGILGGTGSVLALLIFLALRVETTGTYERTFDARADRLWRIWNDPAFIRTWWGPKGYTAPFIRNDTRVGGTYLWSMKSPAGEMSWTTGVYREVVPDVRMVATMSFCDANGRAIPGSEVSVPGHWPDESLVTTAFSERNGRTTVRVTEAGVPFIITLLASFAWAQQFDKVQEQL